MIFKTSIRARLVAAFGILLMMLTGGALMGVAGVARSNQDTGEIFEQGLVPLNQLFQINELMRQDLHELVVATITRGSAQTTTKYVARVEKNQEKLERLIHDFLATAMGEDTRALVQDWSKKREDFLVTGLKPAIEALRSGNFADAEDALLGVAVPRHAKAQAALDAIVTRRMESATTTFADAGRRFWLMAAAVVLATLLALIIAGVLGALTTRAIVGPLVRLNRIIEAFGKGDTSALVGDTDRRDEIGPLARALEQWRLRLIEETERHARERRESAEREARQRSMEDATRRFDTNTLALLSKIRAVVEHLHSSANELSANARKTQAQTATVSTATEKATTNVETVSAAGTELMGSIQEIARQVQQSAETAREAAHEAEETNTNIAHLAEAARKIGAVVSLINGIAGQTNLLALNATIEAARAGEAGKGFAVVAHEVKTLAGQTAHATDDISQQVTTIQNETRQAVDAIQIITQTITRINEMATSIASAVEEQNAATTEIARSVEFASAGTREVAINIAEVARAAAETGRMAEDVFKAANDLLAESADLERETQRFLSEVRAA